jgi:hypothetical protein
MALIIDPDDLSQGLETATISVAWTSSAGADTVLTASGDMPTYAANDIFEVRESPISGNNGLYIATGSPTASNLPCTKIDGPNPTDDTSESVDFYGDNGATLEYKSIHIDTGQKRLYLIEQGNLSTDGVTLQCVYSFMKEEWKADADHIKFAFPVTAITPEQFEFSTGWEPRTVVSPVIQSKKLIRTAGWAELDPTDTFTQTEYMGAITLGTFEAATDTAWYTLGDDPTDTSAATDFTFADTVNEAIKTYEDYGVPGNVVIATNNNISKTGGTSFITFGFKVGGQVTVQNAEDSGNDGSWTLTAVTADALTVSGTPLTNNADDDTIQLAADNRNDVSLYLRIRDADPNGKTFDYSDNTAIGITKVDNKAFRFPLSNQTDLQISETDANIAANPPYTSIVIKYFDQAYARDALTGGAFNFGIVIDVGTHSLVDGSAPGAASVLTSAEGGIPVSPDVYDGGTLYCHEGTDEGVSWPIVSTTATTVTVTGTISSVTNGSFHLERATPLQADKNEIYEKVQYLLRQASDIDDTDQVVTGKTADEMINFVASNDVRFGESAPTNPNGGGTGVICEGFDTNDTNFLYFFDNTGTSRNYPFVAAGTINFNTNLYPDDSAPEYWMFFEYITRTTVSDFAISSAAGDTASFDSAGAELPTVAQNDYVRLTDMTNSENNGVWVVTDAAPTTSQFDARKVDGQTVVDEGAASHPVDWKPIDSPQAIIVNDNGGTPIEGAIGAASASFDFDYDGNTQGGRSAGSDAAIVIRAIGLEDAQFTETTGEITRATGLTYSVVAPLERNYQNP